MILILLITGVLKACFDLAYNPKPPANVIFYTRSQFFEPDLTIIDINEATNKAEKRRILSKR
jgi:hypothetical protein